MCDNKERDNKKKKVRFIDLNDLPRIQNGRQKGNIDWKNCSGLKVDFEYDGVIGEIEIVEYKTKGRSQYLNLRYKDGDLFRIDTTSFRKYKIQGLIKDDLFKFEYDETNPRRIDLRNVPTNGSGIDWKKVAGNKTIFNFVYDNINGELQVIDYDGAYLYVKYLDYDIYPILTGGFTNARLRGILRIRTSEFKMSIGTTLKDNKRDLIILDMEYREKYVVRKRRSGMDNEKWYKYKCYKCGYEGWKIEGSLLSGCGCPVCCDSPQVVVENINSIVVKAPWMIPYFQGGYDEAKLYTPSSNYKLIFKCPDCERLKNKTISISNLYSNHSIRCPCGDGKSYNEKFMFAILERLLGNNFETEKYFEWSKNIKHLNSNLCGNKRYDFYFEFNNKKYIIETHGIQHYKSMISQFKKSLNEEQENDKIKKQLALNNNIDYYIILDCRYSEIEWVKRSIMESELSNIFDLSKIDWVRCEEFAVKNLVKVACDFKRNNDSLTSTEIGNIMNLSYVAIIKYLKIGNKLGWCEYSSKQEQVRSGKRSGKIAKENFSKEIEIFKNNASLGIFESLLDLDKKSEELFGEKLDFRGMSAVCRGERKQYKGFVFEYTKEKTVKGLI